MENFTKEEIEVLRNFVTNVESNVFVLKNLPEVVKGALFSRYSRSSKSLKRLLLDEFFAKEIKVGEEFDTKKAEEFYDRVLIGYGDDSVAELAFAHVAFEDVSIIASKHLEDPRIGISPLEKSTRYVYFNKKKNGKYLFYEEPSILESGFGERYLELMNGLFDYYSEMIEVLDEYFRDKFPKEKDISERAYNSTIRAKVCDVLRGILPASTLTNVGLAGNGRAFEYLIVKLRSSPLKEMNLLAKKAYEELSKVIPSFVKRSFSKHGDVFVEYLRSVNSGLSSFHNEVHPNCSSLKEGKSVKLLSIKGTEREVLAGLLFEYCSISFEEALRLVDGIGKKERKELFLLISGLRKNRRHKPPRAFELVNFSFEIILNYGAYRDLQRHRILTPLKQRLTTYLGYDVPKEIKEIGKESSYKKHMEWASSLFKEIEKELFWEAQYVVPLSFRIRWLINLNLRELFHLCELRSSPQGHDDYREVAIKMAKMVLNNFPNLEMAFLNEQGVELNRLEAERKLDKKIEMLKRKYKI